ncbi:MAG: hypothetical protein ABIR92_05435 [Gemmatimonadaceae bacterium]
MHHNARVWRMRNTTSLFAALIVCAAARPAAGQEMAHMNMDAAGMEKMMMDWPQASKDAAMFMTKKYGAPAGMTADMIMWGKTGPWKRTIVYKMEYAHDFPMPHTDVMQQWIDYRVPPHHFNDLAWYDGSVVAERTAGEISARCDKEAANFLALNLTDDIVKGRMSVNRARKMYMDQIMAMKAMKPAPYTEGFRFTVPMGGTSDADHPGPAKMKGKK